MQDLNGLRMVVRFEADVAIPPAEYPRTSFSGVDEITKMMNDARLSRAARVADGQLQIVEGGSEVSSEAIVELNTRRSWQMNFKPEEFDWGHTYASLFFSQTSQHFLALHDNGQFIELQRRRLTSSEFQAVERSLQDYLKQVRKVLDLIREVVVEHGSEGRISLVCVGKDLKVYKRISKVSCLPEQTLNLFRGKS